MHTDTFDSCNLELLRAKCLHSITRNVVHYLFIQKHECMEHSKRRAEQQGARWEGPGVKPTEERGIQFSLAAHNSTGDK
jgi:hypothetical protein